MTVLILQGSKNILVTYYTKNHYKTTQDLGLQKNVMVRKTTIFFCSVTAGKENFLPGHCHRKSAQFSRILLLYQQI